MNKAIYGIRTSKINGFAVYTIKLYVSNNSFNFKLLKDTNLPFHITQSSNKLGIDYVTLDPSDFDAMTTRVGKALKAIAQNNLDNKYFWVR